MFAPQVCVGEYYLRLLLESSAHRDSRPFPLRDPPAFFRALYHRFLCDADTGLSIEGVDESSQSLPREDFCDVNGLDGFGGSGGVGGLTRELCARAMALVYEQHKERIGPFDGTAHVTVLLDRTNDRALRHRLLLLLQVSESSKGKPGYCHRKEDTSPDTMHETFGNEAKPNRMKMEG